MIIRFALKIFNCGTLHNILQLIHTCSIFKVYVAPGTIAIPTHSDFEVQIRATRNKSACPKFPRPNWPRTPGKNSAFSPTTPNWVNEGINKRTRWSRALSQVNWGGSMGYPGCGNRESYCQKPLCAFCLFSPALAWLWLLWPMNQSPISIMSFMHFYGEYAYYEQFESWIKR